MAASAISFAGYEQIFQSVGRVPVEIEITDDMSEFQLPTGFVGNEQFMSVIVLTVAISVYTHGISAVPLSRRYGHSSVITD